VVKAERSLFGYQKKLKERPYVYVAVSECKAWGQDLKARPDRKAASLEAAGGEKPDREGEFLDEPKKIVAALKALPKEMMPMLRQALIEILDEDMPTLMRVKARRAAAVKTKAKLEGRNKNGK
jgi:hypothetical protein